MRCDTNLTETPWVGRREELPPDAGAVASGAGVPPRVGAFRKVGLGCQQGKGSHA